VDAKNPIKELSFLYPRLFVDSAEKCRECNVAFHSINTLEATPVRQKLRRKSPREEEKIAEHVEELMKNGIVERGSGPWAANIFGVPKGENGTRYVIDFRQLNEVTKKHAYPIPNIDSLLDQLANSTVFSTLDLYSGYYQVPVAESDREKTGFITSHGLFQFKRMPFGLTNAPATFQSMMEVVLQNFIGKFVSVYIDDVTIYSKSFEEHYHHLRLVCEALDKASLSVNLKKCKFFKSEVKVLGFIVGQKGISIDPEKISVIQSLEKPKNVADLRSVLGVLSWLRRFVPNFAKIALPLTSLLSKSREWKWTNVEETALEELKKTFIQNAILVFPDFLKPFELSTDASGKAIGAVLTQDKRIVQCVSRALTAAELNYTTTEKECLAIVFAIKKLRYYLYGNQVTILTDHRCLTSVLKLKDPTGRIARWMLAIGEISPQIKYIPGPSNVLADRMSRLSVHLAEECYLVEVVHELLTGRTNLLDLPLGMRRLAARLVGKYFIQDGKFYRKMTGRPAVQVILENSERKSILKRFHDEAGHFGAKSTFEAIFAHFWWPDLYLEVKAHLQACQICQRNGKPKPQKATGKVFLSGILDKWGIDFVKMPLTSLGNQYLLVAVEYVSNLVVACPTRNQDSATVKNFLLQEVISQFGAPIELVSDNGLCFSSKEFLSFLGQFQIKRCPTTIYHPQANGRCERMNGVLTKLLGNLSREKRVEWDRLVKLALLILKMKTNSATGMSPFTCLFGIPSRTLDLALDRSSSLRTFELKDRLNEIHCLEDQREQIIGKFNSQTNPDDSIRKHAYQPNDLVLVHTPAIKDNSKLKQPWAGPFRVHQVFPSGHVRLSSADQTHVFPHATNPSLLRPYYSNADAVRSSRTNSHLRREEFVAELQKRAESWKAPQSVPRPVQ
jgi:transposase InsO family protein